MTIEKIKEVLDDSEYLTQEYTSEGTESHYKVNKVEAAKEIYKLHLEAQLELLHTVNDEAYKYISTHEEIISNYCEELETKLKELE